MAKTEVQLKVPDEFIKNLQGKDFILYGGLVHLATEYNGLISISTQIIQLGDDTNGNVTVVKAIAVAMVDGVRREFHGYGDAGPLSVSKMILPHAIRMAETRAKARALRDLTNVGMTAFEEMYEAEEVDRTVDKPKKMASVDENIATALASLGELGAIVAIPSLKNDTEKNAFLQKARFEYVRINKLVKDGRPLSKEELTVA